MYLKNIRNAKVTYMRALLVICPVAAATASDSCVAFTCAKAFSHWNIKRMLVRKIAGIWGFRDETIEKTTISQNSTKDYRIYDKTR
jgi:hypothetical protein